MNKETISKIKKDIEAGIPLRTIGKKRGFSAFSIGYLYKQLKEKYPELPDVKRGRPRREV